MNSLRSTLPNPYSQTVPDFNVPKVTNEGHMNFSNETLHCNIFRLVLKSRKVILSHLHSATPDFLSLCHFFSQVRGGLEKQHQVFLEARNPQVSLQHRAQQLLQVQGQVVWGVVLQKMVGQNDSTRENDSACL
jgi:hypothetical protein